MSVWTHVVGCIRIDGLPQLGVSKKSDIEAILGPISRWDDENWERTNQDCTLPAGSEGSLQYQIIEYDTGAPWLCVPVWGDLRDFDDTDAIVRWWSDTIAKFPLVRDAVLRVSVEGREPVVLHWPQYG